MSIFDINNDNTLEVTGEYLESLGFKQISEGYLFNAYIPVYGAITTKSSILYLTKTQQISSRIYNVAEDHMIGPTLVNDTLDVIMFIEQVKRTMIQFQEKLYEGHGKEWLCEPMDKDDPFKIVSL